MSMQISVGRREGEGMNIAATRCHRMEGMGRLKRGLHQLPKRDRISERRVAAVSCHEQAEIDRGKEKGGDA